MPDYQHDEATTERVSRVTWLLIAGWTPTTAEAAARLGLSWGGAYRLLCRLQLPLYQDDDKRWRLDKSELIAWVREAMREDVT